MAFLLKGWSVRHYKERRGAGSNSCWICSPHIRDNILIFQLTTLVED